MKTPNRKKLPALLATHMALLSVASAQTAVSWDAGGGADTNTSNGLNWNPNGVPAFGPGVQATMTTGGTANVDNAMIFGPTATPTPALAFGGNFTLSGGVGGSVTLYGSSSGTQPVLRSNSAATAVTIGAPLRIFSTAPSASPLGNLLVLLANNTNAANTALNITGGISLASGSTGTSYDLRFGNGSNGTTGAGARIAGTISGLGTIANANNIWNGKLTIAGNQSLGSSNITIGSGAGFGNPAAAAQIVLGESSSDVQTWNNVTLNNTMTVAVGGTIAINAISGTTTAGKIIGTGASGATLKINSGTLNSANIAVGGSTVSEKTLDIVKQGSGTLTVSGAHTYTGATSVDAGTLAISASTTLATSGLTVNSGGTLNNGSTAITAPVLVKAGGTLDGEGSSGQLSFGNGSSIFNFDASTGGAYTASSYSGNSSALVLITPTTATSIGNTYLVMTNTGTFSSIPTEFAPSARGSLSLAAGNTQLNFTPTAAASLKWTGSNGTNPTFWDAVNTVNWTNAGSGDRFYTSDGVTFDDSASSFTVSAQGTSVTPGNIAFSNATNTYAVSGGTIAGAGSITKSGAGTTTIANALTNTGGVSVSAGTLTLNGTSNFGSAGITVSGGTLNVNAASTIGAAGISVTSGALNLNAANTITSGISVTGGSLTTTSASSLGSFGSARTITLGGGALTMGGASNLSSDNINLDVTGNSSLGVSTATTTLRVGGSLTGSGDLTIDGSGVVALGRNASNASYGATYSGAISVNNGAVLSLRNENSLGTTGAGTTVKDGGTLMLDPFNQSTLTLAAEPIAFQGNSTLSNRLNGQGSLATTFSGPITTAGTLKVNTLGGDSSIAFNGSIGGAGGVTFGGSTTVSGLLAFNGGTFTYNTSNSYAGATTINAGTLVLGGSNLIANTSSLVLGGGSLSLNGNAEAMNLLTLTANGTIDLGSGGSIAFSDSSGQDWSTYSLSFLGSGFSATSVRFGTNASGLTSNQLNAITVNGLGGYGLDSNGFLVAVPEPATVAGATGLVALAFAALRRRRNQRG